MNKPETVDLLAFMAAFDQRTVGRADVEAWFLNRTVQRLTLEEGKEVVVAFHNEEPDPSGHDRRLTQQQFNRWARIVKDRKAHDLAVEMSRRMVTKGPPDPRPADFAARVAAAAAEYAQRTKV